MSTTTEPTRETWLAERKGGIGGSDAAAVLGASEYKSPFALWSEKVGLIELDDLATVEAVEWGNRLEGPVLEAYADRTGRHVERWPQYTSVRHVEHDWMRCTPDAQQIDDERGPGLVQAKTTSAWLSREWADEPPLAYQVQLMHELAVMGATWGTLVALIGGQKLVWFDLEINDAFVSAMVAKEAEFWQMVLTRTPPPIDGSPSAALALAKLHPDDDGSSVLLDAEADDWAQQLADAKAAIKAAEAAKSLAENRIKAAIAGATFAVTPKGQKFSFKTQERAEYVCSASRFRVLRPLKG